MFRSIRSIRLGMMIREAKNILRNEDPLPLTMYAALDEAGVDIEELERNARNG